MAELLNAIFYSFWIFAGTVILLSIVAQAAVAILGIIVAGGRRNG